MVRRGKAWRRLCRGVGTAALCLVGAAGVLAPGCDNEACPADDGLDCTRDVCENGQTVHELLPKGATCAVGGKLGSCAADGRCVAPCKSEVDCRDADPCTEDVCVDGACVHTRPAGLPAPPFGVCQNALCIGGEPTYLPLPDGTACGKWTCEHGICDGCERDSDCGVSNECAAWICDSDTKTCEIKYTAAGVRVLQVDLPQDCRALQCDGKGGMVVVPDPGDHPPSDGLECTEDRCDGWGAVYAPRPVGEKCSKGLCDGLGNCLACLLDIHCPQGQFCFQGQCGDFCHDTIQDIDETAPDCGGSRCDKCLGEACSLDTDCASGACVDKVCCAKNCPTCFRCDTPGNEGSCKEVVSGVPDMPGCTNGTVCNGSGSCVGIAGTPCTQANQCLSKTCINNKCG